MLTAPPYIVPLDIEPADIDFMGHVNNASYLKWVQHAVLSHWRRIAPPAIASAYLWVALKHEISYRKPAFLDDRVIATVRLERVRGASAFYETVIKCGEEILAEVKSRWCCLDAETLRPKRVEADVIQHFLAEAA